jgi:hypothetical protein
MKKRILLILAFGVSFTPAVFAGELAMSETNPQGIHCAGVTDSKKHLPGDYSEESHAEGYKASSANLNKTR